MIKLFVKYRVALLFLLKFIGVYFILSLFYSFLLIGSFPTVDFFTEGMVSIVTLILNATVGSVSLQIHPDKPLIGLYYQGREILTIFEGCNGINLWIVFVSFIFAYGPFNLHFVRFLFTGSLLIYLSGLLRLILLFWVVLKFPQHFYFLHKYLFTALIYALVFFLWVVWIRNGRKFKHVY
jgi:exosortase family protein XrtF